MSQSSVTALPTFGPTKPMRLFAADHEPIRRLAAAEGILPAELVHLALERYRGGAGEATAGGFTGAEHAGGASQALAQPAGPRELLLVVAAGEEWALPLASVREVAPYQAPRSVGPGLGVALLRGSAIPVRDLSAALGAATEVGSEARIVVVGGEGFAVDAVRGVVSVAAENRQAPPDGSAPWVTGVLRVAGRIVLELAPEQAF